jgi:malonate-semialdehyde dehydrogenase (acetylating) / methylmalonate-semialdehyde dehydrogenase
MPTTSVTKEATSPSMSSNGIIKVDNYIGGKFVAPSSGDYLDVLDPAVPGKVIAKCGISTAQDVEIAVQAAEKALPAWSKRTIKARAAIMMKFHAIMEREANALARMIVLENGKNITEALAEVAKANETVEYACSLPQLAQGKILRVSSQVMCEDRRVPLGVVASIVPFNFPRKFLVYYRVCQARSINISIFIARHTCNSFNSSHPTQSWSPCGRFPLLW